MSSPATFSPAPSLAALLLRATLGTVFVAHAALKLFVYGLAGTAAFFAAHGLPGWTAYPVVAAELFGGLALLLGIGTRWVALGLVPVMLGALTVHWPNGFWFTAPEGGWEYVAFLALALVVQALLGDGAYALQHALPGLGGEGWIRQARVGGRELRATGRDAVGRNPRERG